jgi:Flp pilus assembly protein TadG
MTTAFPSFRDTARRLRRDRRGAALPILTIGLITVIGAVGAAFDLTRIYVVRTQMQSAVDAAALAGARAFGNTGTTDQGRDRQVSLYFKANFPDGYLGMPVINPQPTYSAPSGVNTTYVSAEGDVPTTFMSIFGMGATHVSVHAQAEHQPKPIEVMVVLDDTGSMQTQDVGVKGVSRMRATQNAMLNFNNVIHQGAASRAELAMGFVTYNVTTNVGQVLKDAGVSIESVDGFSNVGDYTGGSSEWGSNGLAWKGCVMNDTTVPDVSASPSTFETGAWDVTKTLPGEGGNPAVKPYLYPPSTLTSYTYPDPADPSKTKTQGNVAYSTNAAIWEWYKPQHLQNNTSDGRTNNLYRLGPKDDPTVGQRLANTAAYRKRLYDLYIGLNKTNANPADDVVVADGTNGYYSPPTTYTATGWHIDYSRLPYINDDTAWGAANAKYAYPYTWSSTWVSSPSGYNLSMPTPNWQCPNPAMPIKYGRAKSDYDSYIRNENHPVMPASGTLHHIGFLWGYRLLTRSDKFLRTNPIEGETPLRALIFMTDGETAASGNANWFGAYGFQSEKLIFKNSAGGDFTRQVMRRFAKVCQAAKNDGITVYIVSLKADVSEFGTCAGSRYWNTTDAATINSAFNEIAVDLVDLHLTQ